MTELNSSIFQIQINDSTKDIKKAYEKIRNKKENLQHGKKSINKWKQY